MSGRPLRFALDRFHHVVAGAQRRDENPADAIDRIVELARAGDQAGIDSFWLNEDPDGWDAVGVLSVIARETERIRLGPGVMNPYYRHPAQIAASMSTLDIVSEGRAFLGFGRGQPEWYERALGIEVGSPLAALEEAFGLFRQWLAPPWTGSAPEDATQFRVTRWEREIGPVQERMPIYLAAVGPRALWLAGRLADGVLFNELSSEVFLERAVRQVREEAAEHGRDPDALRFFARSSVTVTREPEAVWDKRKATIALIHALPGMERLLEVPGFDIDRIISDVRTEMRTMEVLERGGNFPEIRRAGDLAAAKRHIPDALMRELVVAGPIDEVRARIERLRGIGITDVFLAPPSDPDGLGEIVSNLGSATGSA